MEVRHGLRIIFSRKISYIEMEKLGHECAAGLRHFGIKKGDRVGFFGEAGWQWMAIHFGNQFVGAATVLREPFMTTKQIMSMIINSKLHAAVVPTHQVYFGLSSLCER
jgi:long-subunit acyl-CoA synthetase (AMP-forming)